MKLFYPLLLVSVAAFAGYDAHADTPSSASELPSAAFAQLPQMDGAELSPDGKYIAYLFPLEGRNHIVMQPVIDFDKRKIVPPAGKLDFDWVQWANNERLVFSASFIGERFNTETTETRLASIKKDGKGLEWIVRSGNPADSGSSSASDIPPQIQDDVISWLPDEPNHILVALDENFDGQDEVRRIDITSGEYTNIRGGLPGIQNWLVDADHQVRMGFGYDANEFNLRFLNSEQQWVSGTTTSWWESGWHPVAFTQDPSVAYVIGPGDSGRDVVRKMNIETGAFTGNVFAAGLYDVEGVVLNAHTREPIGVSYTEKGPKIKYFDGEFDRLQRTAEKAFSGMTVRLLSLSNDKKQVLVHVSSDTDAGVLYLWDRDVKSMDVYNEAMPGLVPELLSPMKAVTYKARDGQEIPGFLTTPRNQEARKLPTIVLPHGGPDSRTSKRFGFITQFLASRGYAVFQPNFRGSTGYGAQHYLAGKNQWGALMQDDVTDGAKWLVETGVADPERMCIAGWSYGGYVAAMGAVKTPDLFQCAVSINGPLDLYRYASKNQKSVGARHWIAGFGQEGEGLKTVSPYHQAERIKIPLLLIQAGDDTRVPKEQAERMQNRLSKLGKSVDVLALTQGGHDLDNASARDDTLNSLEAFFAKHIGP